MNRGIQVSAALGIFMLLAALIAVVMTPSSIATTVAEPDFQSLIPSDFGNWKVDSNRVSQIINPEVQGELNKLYSQMVSRTYIDAEGQRVMLVIAYGRSQKTDLHAHRPEVCYTAGGFEITGTEKVVLKMAVGSIPAIRMVARRGARTESITYWIRVGNVLTRGWVEQKLAAMTYGMRGEVPDGALIRVSSISTEALKDYELQQSFLSELLQAMQAQDRFWLLGNQIKEARS